MTCHYCRVEDEVAIRDVVGPDNFVHSPDIVRFLISDLTIINRAREDGVTNECMYCCKLDYYTAKTKAMLNGNLQTKTSSSETNVEQ